MSLRHGTIASLVRGVLLPLAGLLLLAAPVAAHAAGNITGFVTQVGTGTPVPGLQVQAWRRTAKGYILQTTTSTAADGSYTFAALPNGNYKIMARSAVATGPTHPGAPFVSGANYTDRWVQSANPATGGWMQETSDAVVISGSNAAGINIEVEAGAYANGRVLIGTTPVAGYEARLESIADPRQNHQTKSKTEPGINVGQPNANPQLGHIEFTGIKALDNQRLWIHDDNANYEDKVVAGPFSSSVGNTMALGDNALTAMTPDAYETAGTNDTLTSATTVPTSGFYTNPPTAWVSSGALLGPRRSPGDVDWYCWTVQVGDRYIVTASTATTVGGQTRYNPWVDPYLVLYSSIGGVETTDDDSGPGPLDAQIDTASFNLATAGNGGAPMADRYCAVVTTYGDTNFDGTNQASASLGRYTLQVQMGNRPPSISQPTDGSTQTVAEGGTATVTVGCSDPDSPSTTTTAVLKDSTGQVVAKGTFTPAVSGCGGTWSWTTGPQDSNYGPYQLVVTVSDGEFQAVSTVTIVVTLVNLPPTTPTQLDPADASIVTTFTPGLVIQNSTDPNGDTLTYDYELYYVDPTANPGAMPDQAITGVAEDPSGQTTAAPSAIPENTTVYWRVRANDGNANNNYSPWTGYFSFFVNTVNDPPLDPVLTNPADGSTVSSRTPTLTVNNTTDPEGDAITFDFQVATDNAFTNIVADSGTTVAQNTAGQSTNWVVPAASQLSYGASYFARAKAVDALGAESGWSNINGFTVINNTPPTQPALGAPFDAQCNDYVFTTAPSGTFTVTNATDAENDPLQLQLQIWNFADDPTNPANSPLVDITQAQSTTQGTTDFALNATQLALLVENSHYMIRVRAYDGTDYSTWGTCDFWINTVNSPPSDIAIISPTPGSPFPAGTAQVTVQVKNASDPDYNIPGSTLSLAHCLSQKQDFSDCPADPTQWPNPTTQTSNNPADQTTFDLTGLKDGQKYFVEVAAIDDTGLYGPTAQTNFHIESNTPVTDGGTSDGGGTKSGNGGCCTTARAGQPVMALWAALGLLLLLPRRRRRW